MFTTLDLIKEQFKFAREQFEGTVADLTPEMLGKHPGGVALPIEAVYAHLIFSEDFTVAGMLQGKPSLFDTTWKGKTGISAVMPPIDDNWPTAHAKWAKEVTIDLDKIKKYSQAIYAQTDAYLGSLKDKDLSHEIDLGDWGKKKLYDLLTNFLIGHSYSLSGEISAAKGIQGAKGYPF